MAALRLKGKATAYEAVRKFAEMLRSLHGVPQEIATEWTAFINEDLKKKLKSHVDSGTALATSKATAQGEKRIVTKLRLYLLHPGKSDASKAGKVGKLFKWSWRNGIPLYVLRKGKAIFEAAVRKRVSA